MAKQKIYDEEIGAYLEETNPDRVRRLRERIDELEDMLYVSGMSCDTLKSNDYSSVIQAFRENGWTFAGHVQSSIEFRKKKFSAFLGYRHSVQYNEPKYLTMTFSRAE